MKKPSHIVPPVPKGLPPAQLLAFKLWRRGLSVRSAAAAAGVAPGLLFQLVSVKNEVE